MLLLASMAVLVIQKAKREAALPIELGPPDESEVSGVDEEILRVERESREMGKPLTPERARDKLKQALALPQLNVRATTAGEITRDLCQSGYTEEAWSLLDPAKGQVRDMQLMAYFRYARLAPQELLNKVNELADKAEARQALDGYLSAGTLEELQQIAELPGLMQKIKEVERGGAGGETKPILIEIIRDRARAARSDEERDTVVSFARNIYHLKGITANGLLELSVDNDLRDIFERWKEIHTITAAEGLVQKENPHRNIMLRKMMLHDPAKALPLLTPYHDEQGIIDLAEAFTVWDESRPEELEKWLKQHGPGLKPAERDYIYTRLAKAATAREDEERAKHWAAFK